MALSGLTSLLVNQADTLVPHIEEAALRYSMRRYVMPQRVTVYGDMQGWNVRKVSEYIRPRRAQDLQEDTPIPNTNVVRVRKAEIEPNEVGDRHRISDRRQETDLEDVIADTIEFLGQAIGDRKEADMLRVAINTFTGGNIDGTGAAYSLDYPIDAQFEFRKRARRGQLYHVIHPFQARDIMKDLADYASGTNLDFRNQAIRGWDVPSFDGLNVAISDFVPRNIINYVDVGGDGGTFRLQVGMGYAIGENITDEITFDATEADMATAIETELNALDMSSFYDGSGSWSVATTGTTYRFEVTPPADLWLDAEQELRVAVKYDDDANLDGEKSAYDLLTNPTLADDVNGDAQGVLVHEASATAKSLLFFPQAIVYDVRKPVTAFFELVNQGRTAEYSAYETYGVGKWRHELGMTIETDANSAFALG